MVTRRIETSRYCDSNRASSRERRPRWFSRCPSVTILWRAPASGASQKSHTAGGAVPRQSAAPSAAARRGERQAAESEREQVGPALQQGQDHSQALALASRPGPAAGPGGPARPAHSARAATSGPPVPRPFCCSVARPRQALPLAVAPALCLRLPSKPPADSQRPGTSTAATGLAAPQSLQTVQRCASAPRFRPKGALQAPRCRTAAPSAAARSAAAAAGHEAATTRCPKVW